MPKSWLCIPSARPIAEVVPVVAAWKAQGYGVALFRNDLEKVEGADLIVDVPYYPGYARAVNHLAAMVLETYPEVDWIVAGGDDTFPDPNKTGDEIAEELSQHFKMLAWPKCWHWAAGYKSPEDALAAGAYAEQKPQGLWGADIARLYSTWGVAQPTGDDWSDHLGKIIDRIAGSPWLGRTWCERANAGKGPMWPEFRHQFVDEHLQRYAQHLGVFLQRPDLTHHHAHAQRGGVGKPAPHMTEWNSQKHWVESKAIFDRLIAGNFEECKPIA